MFLNSKNHVILDNFGRFFNTNKGRSTSVLCGVVDPNLLNHYAPEIWVNADPDSAYEDFANADRNLC